jgi:hypothetical protein
MVIEIPTAATIRASVERQLGEKVGVEGSSSL